MIIDSSYLEEQSSPSRIPTLSRVIQICFHGLIPSDLSYFSIILNALPNLFRLDLSMAYLSKLIKEPQICSLLNQRITSLCIFENEPNSSFEKLNEKHLPMIASALSRVRDLQTDIMHLSSSATRISISEDSFQQDLLTESGQEEVGTILPLSSESMLLCILTTFNEHKLTALCIDGHFINEVETDTEQWLRMNTNLGKQPFQAAYHKEVNRLLIWM